MSKGAKLWISVAAGGLLLALTLLVLGPRIVDTFTVGVAPEIDAASAEVVESGAALVATPKESNGALVLYAHGAEQSHRAAIEDDETATLTAALLEAGYTVAAAEAEGTAWGSPASVAAYDELLNTTLSEHNLDRVYIIGESMGGLPAAQLAANRDDVFAWVGIYPVCDLSSIVDQTLAAQIDRAYPGGRPGELTPVDWSAKPLMAWASPDDTLVPSGENAFACGRSDNVTVIETRGEHGDASNFDAAAVVEFFDAH